MSFQNIKDIQPNVLEYQAPELLQHLDTRDHESSACGQHKLDLIIPSALDVFSLGIILIEIVSGYPVANMAKMKWTHHSGKPLMGTSVFFSNSVSSKPGTVAQRQIKFINSLNSNLKKIDQYGLGKDNDFVDLLSQMLKLDPKERITAENI